jgi:hypothetical protein
MSLSPDSAFGPAAPVRSRITRVSLPLPQMKPHHRFFNWLTTASLLVLLLSQLLGNFAGLPVSVAFAATKPQTKPGSLTLQQFLRMGRHDVAAVSSRL